MTIIEHSTESYHAGYNNKTYTISYAKIKGLRTDADFDGHMAECIQHLFIWWNHTRLISVGFGKSVHIADGVNIGWDYVQTKMGTTEADARAITEFMNKKTKKSEIVDPSICVV